MAVVENENDILYEYLFGWGNEVGNVDDCAVSFQINSKSVFLSTAPSHAKTDQHQGHQKQSSHYLSQMLEPGEHLR